MMLRIPTLIGLTASALIATWILVGLRADAENAETIALGRTIYETQCAACHGAQLEGQPDWQMPLPSGRLPAPPHDATGHTWHHPDDILFRIVKEGTAAIVGGGYESDMPGFADVLSDAEIRAVLAYIKSTWPERERSYQAETSARGRSMGGRRGVAGHHPPWGTSLSSLWLTKGASVELFGDTAFFPPPEAVRGCSRRNQCPRRRGRPARLQPVAKEAT